MVLVRRALGQSNASIPRFSSSLQPLIPKKTVHFYFDFASPWYGLVDTTKVVSHLLNLFGVRIQLIEIGPFLALLN
jgi:hypothetical protein